MTLPEPIPIPQFDRWVERLRKGNLVWLVKEKEYARISWEWEPPEPGHKTGRMAIDRFSGQPAYFCWIGQQTWWIGGRGEGIDGKQLIVPCEGELPENPPPLPEVVERELRRALAQLDERISKLEGEKWLDTRARTGRPSIAVPLYIFDQV